MAQLWPGGISNKEKLFGDDTSHVLSGLFVLFRAGSL